MDMIRWVVENLTIEYRKFRNSRMELMGSFRSEDIKKMYHIGDPHDIYDKTITLQRRMQTPSS